jgi:hypothetical protein
MNRRTQGTFRAILMIAGVIVPAVVVAWLAYNHYVDGRREYLTRLDYRELRIAGDQLRSRVGGIVGSWRLSSTSCGATRLPVFDDPAVSCAPKEPATTSHDLVLEEFGEGLHLWVRGGSGQQKSWAFASIPEVLSDLNVDEHRFGDVLLMSADGWVLHGRDVHGISICGAMVADSPPGGGAGKDAAPAAQGPAAACSLGPSHVYQVKLHDTYYLLFVEPTSIRVAFARPDEKSAQTVELVLGGLVPRDRFENETGHIAYRWLLLAVLLLVLGLLAWPLLRVRLIGAQERLRAADVRVLALAFVGLAGVWPVVLLVTQGSLELATEFDSQLPEVSQQVTDAFNRRLREAFEVLAQVDASASPMLGPNVHSGAPKAIRTSVIRPDGVIEDAWDVYSDRPAIQVPSVNLNVADRAYFQAAKRGDLWACGEEPCIAEVVRSRRQGVLKLIVARPVGDKVVIAGTEIDAFTDPLLPAGVDFAVIDDSGKVQLHSHSARDLVENFFEGVDDPAELRAAVGTEGTTTFTATYAGDEALFRVQSLGDTLWTLLVFRSVPLLQAVILEAVARWAGLFIGYLLLGFAGFLLFEAITGRYRFCWLWPDRTVPTTVYALVATRTAMLALLGWAAFDGAGTFWRRAAVVGAMPIFGLVVAGRDLAQERDVTTPVEKRAGLAVALVTFPLIVWAAHWYGTLAVLAAIIPARRLARGVRVAPASEASFRAGYVACLAALLALLATMPATALFGDALAEVRREFGVTLQQPFQAGHSGVGMYETSFERGLPGGPAEAREDTFADSALSPWVARFLPTYSGTVAAMRQAIGGLPHMPGLRCLLLWMGAVLVLLLGVVTLRALVIRVFQLDADALGAEQTLPPTASRAAVFVYRRVRTEAPEENEPDELRAIDLRATSDPKELQTWWSRRGGCRRFELRHVETRLHDLGWQEAMLAVLEASVFDPRVSLVVTSAMEPFHYLRARIGRPSDARPGELPAAETTRHMAEILPRWSLVLSGLTKERYDLPLPEGEQIDDDVRAALAAYADDVAGAGAETMEGRYRELWRTLTREERLALRQLAEEGFVAPAAMQTIRLLMRRRLVRRAPMLAFSDEGFRAFVLRAESPETIAQWEQAGEQSGFDMLTRLLPAVLLAGLVFVFVTQRDVFNATTTIVGAAGTALPFFLRVLTNAGGDRPSSAGTATV